MLRTILALLQIKGIGNAFIKKNLITLQQVDIHNLEQVCGLDKRISADVLVDNFTYADKIIERCHELNIRICHIGDNLYPKSLMELNDAPAILYLRGNTSLLSSKIVSIIGTRESSLLGNSIAQKVGSFMSNHCSICNGLVDGIDKAAVSNGNSVLKNVIGVIASGLNYEVTSSNITKTLAEQVLHNNGLLISEFEPDKKEDMFSGSKASRIQAGISNAVILVQSSIDGGSKYTLNTISKLNRVLGVVNFSSSNEFNTDDKFSANRLIIAKRRDGLAEMCEIKNCSNIKVEIVDINSSDDYNIIVKKISNNFTYSLF